MDNFTNITEFSCGNTSMLSSEFISDENFWKITEEQKVGATIAGVLILIFFLVGTGWNLFIIITFLVKHRLLKEPGNVFLFNVSITDLLICLSTMVSTYVIAFGKEFIFGNDDVSRCILCKTSGFFFQFLILVSLHLLAALSIDRFILLSKPLRYKRIMNRCRVTAICFIIYIICFILAGLPLVGFGDIEFNARFASCVPRFTPTKNLFYVILIVVEALIPITVLAITNVWTYRLVRRFLKKKFHRRSTIQKKVGGNRDRDEGAKYQRQQNQLVKVFGALFIANIISYTPTITAVFVFAFLSIIGKENVIPAEVYILGFVSFLMNPVLHPIMQSFFVKDLRYQVTRAKKGIHRASSRVYHETAKRFSITSLHDSRKMSGQNMAMSERNTQTTFVQEKEGTLKGVVMNESNLNTIMEESPSCKEETDPPHENDCACSVVINDAHEPSKSRANIIRKERKSVTFKEKSNIFKEVIILKQTMTSTSCSSGQDPTCKPSKICIENVTIQVDSSDVVENLHRKNLKQRE